MVSDEVLMLQFQAGSRECFDELFARYRDPLWGFFRRRIPEKGRAEDLVQEAWVAVLQSAPRYQPRAPFRTYLYGVAYKVLSGERRKRRSQEAAFRDAINSAPAAPESGYWVREALAKLDPTEGEVIMLREYEQLSYAEIGELLHIPVNTVRSRLFRARLALKRHLEADSEPVAAQEGD